MYVNKVHFDFIIQILSYECIYINKQTINPRYLLVISLVMFLATNISCFCTLRQLNV